MAQTQMPIPQALDATKRQARYSAEELKALAEEQCRQIDELITQMAHDDLAPVTIIEQLNNLANELKLAANGFVNSLDSLISKRYESINAIPQHQQTYLALLGADETIKPHLRGNDYNTAHAFIHTAHKINDMATSLEHNFNPGESGYLLTEATKHTARTTVDMIADLGRSSPPNTFYV